VSTPSLRDVMAAGESDEPVGVKLENFKEADAREYAVRFAFGAAIAVIAGVVTLLLGPRAGGLFLAFPAILPASLTLIERHDGNREARADVVGAILGSAGMLAFAIVAYFALPRMHPAATLGLALLAWAVVSTALFFLSRGRP
jgi:hypothetical protein